MSNPHKQTVTDYLSIFHATEPDFDRLQTYLADDAVYQSLVPAASPVRGPAAIREVLEQQYRTYKDCDCEIHVLGADGDYVFTERTDHVTLLKDGRQVSARVNAIFRLNDQKKICEWREYWDAAEVMQQMGVTPAELDEALSQAG